MMSQLLQVSKKEFATFFASLTAFLFLGAFLVANLFIVFWVETFFARNAADLRSFFQWMPLLLIFLVAALTMRLWSEERRMGTLEFLTTQPVSPLVLVIGKFIASLSLVGLALLLTLPLPITVAMMGELDWGPVWGGYLASFFLASAYIGIGLTVSFISDNQIISLILTVIVCLLFYLLGAPVFTSIFDSGTAEILKQFGSGSRFASVARGVLDLGDIYYYLSITVTFLLLNIYLLESRRWAKPGNTRIHWRWRCLIGLLILNVLVANLSLSRLQPLRIDLTENKRYTISQATLQSLDHLKEPLLIRAYFSGKTHPLLTPLIPQLRNLIEEYAVYGNGKVRVEVIDPTLDPGLEQEAAENYGIKPVPLQIIDKYNPSVVNIYFNIVVRYGDQSEVLGFRDLIDTRSQSEGDLKVAIRNPEYDITSAIKKVVSEYQSRGDLYTYLTSSIKFTGYISSDTDLPEALRSYKTSVVTALEKAKKNANGRFDYTLVDPMSDTRMAEQIARNYGFLPMRKSPEDQHGFYFYLLLDNDSKAIQLPVPDNPQALQESNFEDVLESAVKRFSVGFVKKIGLYVPPSVKQNPLLQQYRMPSGRSFQQLRQRLTSRYDLGLVDFDQGEVADDIDVLLILAPRQLTSIEVFAIDQFLMRGGAVIISSGAAEAKFTQYGLSATPYSSGLKDWLEHNGISIENTLVLDPQNNVIPLPVTRDVGGVPMREIKMLNYPYAIDIRGERLNNQHVITSAFDQIPMVWASPLSVNNENSAITVTELLHSSEQSWVSSSMQILPEFDKYPEFGFLQEGEPKSHLLGAVLEGEFKSFYKTRPSTANVGSLDSLSGKSSGLITNTVLQQSLPSARLVIFSSNEFVADKALRLLASANGIVSSNIVNLIENTVDWAVQDSALLSIRNRGYFSRTLKPMTQSKQMYWEYLNYALALSGLMVVFVVYKMYQAHRRRSHRLLLKEVGIDAK